MDVWHHDVAQATGRMGDLILSDYRFDIEPLFHEGVRYKEITRIVNSKHGSNMTYRTQSTASYHHMTLIESRVKMLKDRLRQWNCKKNITKQHVNYMVLKHSERRRLGKETAFRFHGKEQSLQQLGSYWQRHIESIKGVPQGDLPPSPKDLLCFTPPPVPVAAPDDLHYQHRLLRSVQDYCFGNFDAKTWFMQDDDISCSNLTIWGLVLNPLIDHIESAIEFAKIDEKARAQRSLSLAFPLMKQAALDQCPQLMVLLLRSMEQLHRCGDEDLYVGFIKLLSLAVNEVKRYLGMKNPLCIILEALSNKLPRLHDLYVTFWKCLVDSFVGRTGFSCFTAIRIMSNYNRVVLVRQDSQAAIRAQETLVSRCKGLYGVRAFLTFRSRNTLADCLSSARRYQEAEDQLLQAVTDLELSHDPVLVGIYSYALAELAYCQRMNRKFDLAEVTLREAVRNSWIICGKTDSATLRTVLELKWFLTATRRFDALEEVNTQLTEIMEERERLGI